MRKIVHSSIIALILLVPQFSHATRIFFTDQNQFQSTENGALLGVHVEGFDQLASVFGGTVDLTFESSDAYGIAYFENVGSPCCNITSAQVVQFSNRIIQFSFSVAEDDTVHKPTHLFNVRFLDLPNKIDFKLIEISGTLFPEELLKRVSAENFSITPVRIPAPTTLALFGFGFVSLLLSRRKASKVTL